MPSSPVTTQHGSPSSWMLPNWTFLAAIHSELLNPTMSNTPAGSNNTPTDSGDPSGTASGSPPFPNIPLQSDPAWPKDLVLNSLKHNWEQWDWHLNLVIDQCHFSRYLNRTLKCPDAMAHLTAAESNNCTLCRFILRHVSNHDWPGQHIRQCPWHLHCAM